MGLGDPVTNFPIALLYCLRLNPALASLGDLAPVFSPLKIDAYLSATPMRLPNCALIADRSGKHNSTYLQSCLRQVFLQAG